MKMRTTILICLLIVALAMISCDKKKTHDTTQLTTAQALTDYWPAETNLTAALEARDGTMQQITAKINALGSKTDESGFEEIDALVEEYVNQSNTIAARFDDLIRLENQIRPYGASKGILGSICNGVYTAARNKVVSAGKMVRSGWRVMRGTKSLREVLRDPDSGIPFVSDCAEKLQALNAARDAAISQSIMESNTQGGLVPWEELAGTTPQEKLNSYLNLDEEDPIKLRTRRWVATWEEEDRTRMAKLSNELGQTGVRTVGDAYGGSAGEVVNEILDQQMVPGQSLENKGTCNLSMVKDGDGNPPITGNKTIIISRANMPSDDPRITVLMNAPQNIALQLPAGEYDIIGLAQGYIRTTVEKLTMVQGDLKVVTAKLLSMAENAIVIDELKAEPETVTIGETASFHVSCASTLGQALSFEWAVTGGTIMQEDKSQTNYSFKPTQEGDYTVTVTIRDGLNNVKTQSVTMQAVNADLTIEGYEISAESYTDLKANPGEIFTMSLNVKNNGITELTGLQSIEGLENITVLTPVINEVTIPAGDTYVWNVRVNIPANYTGTTGTLHYTLDTVNQLNMPVTIPVTVEFPVDFYAEIEEIYPQPVVNRVLSVVGHVANPQLATATLVVDNDLDQAYTVNLTNGNFSQPINVAGSAVQTSHNLKLFAYSGGRETTVTKAFTSLVPITGLKVTLTWDTSNTDVDLWVTDPNGEKCYYSNLTTDSGLSLDFDDQDGYGPESIISSNIIPGDYLVQCQFYEDNDDENAITTGCQVLIKQNEGSADETNNIYYGTLNDTGDLWNVTTLHYDGVKFSVKPTNTFGKYHGRLPAK